MVFLLDLLIPDVYDVGYLLVQYFVILCLFYTVLSLFGEAHDQIKKEAIQIKLETIHEQKYKSTNISNFQVL